MVLPLGPQYTSPRDHSLCWHLWSVTSHRGLLGRLFTQSCSAIEVEPHFPCLIVKGEGKNGEPCFSCLIAGLVLTSYPSKLVSLQRGKSLESQAMQIIVVAKERGGGVS